MRGTAIVLTVAFVFLSTAVLVHPVAGQSSGNGSLSGLVCPDSPGGYPKPYTGSYPNGTAGAYCQSGQGLPGAMVYLTKPGPVASVPAGGSNRSASTDEQGAYSFTDVPAGDYTVIVARTGFATDSASVSISGGTRHDVSLVAKQVTVSGIVSKASDGKALSDATLSLCCGTDGSSASAVSGSDGKFSMTAKAGWQSLSASRSGFQDTNVYQLFDGAKPVAIAMDAIPPQDANIHGVVRDQHGNPVSGADLWINNYGYGCCYAYGSSGTTTTGSSSPGVASDSMMRPYYGGQNHTATDAQGRYSIHVYSGDNGVSVSKDGYASISMSVHADSGSDTAQDLKLQKFPAKTAHIEGRVTDLKTGKGLRFLQISVQSPEFGIYECSVDAAQANSRTDQPAPSSGPGMGVAMPYPGGGYDNGCRIVVQPDGRFAGDVTPGYAIVQVSYESYRACTDTTDADGSSSHVCGPEYNTWVRSLSLAENGTTKVDAALKPRPSPDAVVSGYLVDAQTGTAIAGGQITFSNEDTQGYGYATTDQDGSYKLRLRSGYHQVYAYADGHLHWQGTLDVKAGNTAYDVQLTPGTESNGGCCYGGPYMMDKGAPMAASSPGMHSATATASYAPGAPNVGAAEGSGGSGGTGNAQYEDLGGGLGPYNAAERGSALANSQQSAAPKGAPALGLVPMLAMLGAVVAVAALRRRL